MESIPYGMIYVNGTTPHPTTYDTWMDLINSAQSSIEIASLYWTLRSTDVVPDASSEEVNLFQFTIHFYLLCTFITLRVR